MRLEGRVALGLDEFMLRIGHLKLLSEVLRNTYGNRTRIARRLGEVLTRPTPIPPARQQSVGEYLAAKRLSVVIQHDGLELLPHAKARYSDLTVHLHENGSVSVEARGGPATVVWFQDVAMSDPRVRSKVGAVTINTREVSNKSGVSHLVDWSVIIGLSNRRLGLTAIGRATAALCEHLSKTAPGDDDSNPYVIGHERLAFAWLLFTSDGDVLTRLISMIDGSDGLSKSDAMEVISAIGHSIREEAARPGGSASVSATRVIRDFFDDLGLTTAGRSRRGKPSSTLWHRVSSRLESLVDLGFLEKKGPQGENRLFDYFYRPTNVLRRAAASLGSSPNLLSWIENTLPALMNDSPEDTEKSEVTGEIQEALKLCLGPTGVHIDSYAVVAATLAFAKDKALTFGEARKRLTDAAIAHPEVIRLSRGYSGSRAEFASVDLRRIAENAAAVFRPRKD